ncbi:MAG TPA: protein phosphatase 2C domain-containing protein [Anaerolineales bacterium]|nr:protein phosphatase 2C domain-containing protein [Anaerolineales bacterium]
MIPTENPHLKIAANTDPGMSGKINEDRYSVAAFRLEDKSTAPSVFALVADGIGGHRAGEIAAELAIETINHHIQASDASKPLETLHQAIQLANKKIYSEAESDPQKKGMGSTCACCWVIGNKLYTAYLGDSRIYLLRKGKLQQISNDHTWIQSALDAGVITPDQAKGHTHAHIISRYLGSQNNVEPDTRLSLETGESVEHAMANQGMQLEEQDQILICSDGLTDLVEDHEIQSILAGPDQDKNIQDLISLANQRGGHDNITIVNLIVPPVPHQNEEQPEPKTGYQIPCLLSSLIILVIVLVILLALSILVLRPV